MWDTSWADQQREQESLRNESERRTVAELLVTRGQDRAAAIVAVSAYESNCVDNWDGGQYEVDLAVPAYLFDQVTEPIRTALDGAVGAVIGTGHYRGLSVSVRMSDPTPGWDNELIAFLRTRLAELKLAELPAD